MRALLIAFATLAASCSPPSQQTAETPEAPAAPSADAETRAILESLTGFVGIGFGAPLSFQPTTVRVQDDWAWVIAQPRAPDGGPLDWSRTSYAEQAREGMLDGDGTTYALLQRQNDRWTVMNFVIGPTDVAYLDWTAQHGAPPELITPPGE